MAKPAKPELDLRWVAALGHQRRVEILDVLDHREASPKQLAEIFDRALDDVSYHTRVLSKAGCIEQVRIEPRRGAFEHFYRSTPRSSFGHQRWRMVPRSLRGNVTATALESFMRRAVAALKSGSIDDRDDTILNWMPMAVDHVGWDEATRVLRTAQARLEEVHEESRKRIAASSDGAMPIIVGLAAFESVGVDQPKKRGS